MKNGDHINAGTELDDLLLDYWIDLSDELWGSEYRDDWPLKDIVESAFLRRTGVKRMKEKEGGKTISWFIVEDVNKLLLWKMSYMPEWTYTQD